MKYIQFIGTQRSGSNLLRVMLNQEPEISAPHPPHILKTFYPLLPFYGDISVESNFHTLAVDICDWVKWNPVPWEGVDLDPSRFIQACRVPSLIEIFSKIYEHKASSDEASIWCCKSMENVYYATAIEQHNLQPFYIYLYRDGRDVALSFKKAIVGPKHVYYLAQKWRKEQELAMDLIAKLPEDRYAMVRYEDLITDPRPILENLCSKLGIPFREEILDYFHSHESQITASSGDMWKNLTQPIIKTNSNKFKMGLSEEEINIFESVTIDLLTHFNYEPMNHKANLRNFSIEEVANFEMINNRLIEETYKKADMAEKERRKPQEELLKNIRSRVAHQSL